MTGRKPSPGRVTQLRAAGDFCNYLILFPNGPKFPPGSTLSPALSVRSPAPCPSEDCDFSAFLPVRPVSLPEGHHPRPTCCSPHLQPDPCCVPHPAHHKPPSGSRGMKSGSCPQKAAGRKLPCLEHFIVYTARFHYRWCYTVVGYYYAHFMDESLVTCLGPPQMIEKQDSDPGLQVPGPFPPTMSSCWLGG